MKTENMISTLSQSISTFPRVSPPRACMHITLLTVSSVCNPVDVPVVLLPVLVKPDERVDRSGDHEDGEHDLNAQPQHQDVLVLKAAAADDLGNRKKNVQDWC